MNEVDCEHCGKTHNLGDHFCPVTGQPLTEAEAPRGITRLYNPKGLSSPGAEVEVRGTPVKTRTFWMLPRWGKGKAVPPHTTPLGTGRIDPHARTDVTRLPGVRSIDRTRPQPPARTEAASDPSGASSPTTARANSPSAGPPRGAGPATGVSTASLRQARPTTGRPQPPPPPPPPPLRRASSAPIRASGAGPVSPGISPLDPTATGRPKAPPPAPSRGIAAGSGRASAGLAAHGASPAGSAGGRRAHGRSVFGLLREALLLPFKQGPTVLLAGAVVFVPGVVLTVLVARLFPGFAPLSGQISGRAMLSSLVVAFPAALTLGIYAATVSLAVADRLGGRKTPFYRYPLWLLTLPRPLVASIVVAAGITALGVPFLLLPGLVLLVLFAFVPFVALFDLEPPATALRRSLRLAGACAGRLGLVCALGLALGWGAWALGGAVAGSVPALVQVAATGLLLLLCAYFPVGAAFLLYLDVKRAQEGFGDVELQAALEAVRPAREPEPVGQTG